MNDQKITLTVKLTFNPANCEDVEPGQYDPIPDFDAVMEYASEYYNLEDWEITAPEGGK